MSSLGFRTEQTFQDVTWRLLTSSVSGELRSSAVKMFSFCASASERAAREDSVVRKEEPVTTGSELHTQWPKIKTQHLDLALDAADLVAAESPYRAAMGGTVVPQPGLCLQADLAHCAPDSGSWGRFCTRLLTQGRGAGSAPCS
ncbi:uncharacterized protein V6R79_005079 [Siganus canaliculatus]